jgi:peptidoglycan/xylan/chitin deacetylase (PgdA/CDA1 family)
MIRTPPAPTSVTPERFSEHLDYLVDNAYRVLPVEQVLDDLAHRRALPERSVAITFDDAYLSVYNIARPMLDARDMPYSVFVSTAPIDAGSDNYMSREQLRRISEYGSTIGNHGVAHQSALARGRNESREEWLQRFRTDAISAQGVSSQSLLYGAPSRSILERDKTSDAERNYPYNIRTAHGPAATPDLTG